MKTSIHFRFFALLIAFAVSNLIHAQIAQNYPNDMNIHNDPNVIFAEMFEQDSIAAMISSSGYQTSQMLSHINFDNSVPPGSLGNQSLKLTTVENSAASNDPSEDANVLKKFSNGITDSVFVRYYVKYNSNFSFHHSGVWMGGTNPANQCWPCNTPGRTIPTSGDSAFVVGSEIRGLANQGPQQSSKFGLYNYWMDMKGFTTGPSAGQYFGNEFISPNANASLDMDSWNCVEVMIKLNNPSDSSGEVKLWLNGQLVGHYGQGFPNGTWNQATFVEGVGSPFDGFRWRSNPAVVFNYIWLKNYSTNNTSTENNDVLYDHVVVAKSYIGPIYAPVGGNDELQTTAKIQLYPNPSNSELNFSEYLNEFSVTNNLGQEIITSKGKSVSTQDLKNGIYFLKSGNTCLKFVVKH